MSDDYQISAAYARLTLQSELLPADALLAGTDFTVAGLQQADFLPWQPVARMFHNLAESSIAPGWTGRLGGQFNIAAHGPLGFAALSAPTLEEALAVMATYYPVRNTGLGVAIEEHGNQYRVRVWDRTGDVPYGHIMGELVLKILESLISAILGHPVSHNVVISLPYPAPDHADALQATFDAKLEFDADCAAISIPASWRRLPSPLHDQQTYLANISKCREIIARRSAGLDPAARVRNLIAIHFDQVRLGDSHGQPPPSLEVIAAQLHVTPRTMIRRLKLQDTSYKELLQQARQDCATELLGRANLSVADIAERLGYREPANFGRAFRRWFGQSPASWRKQH